MQNSQISLEKSHTIELENISVSREDQEREVKDKKDNLLRKICRYVSIISLSMLHGFNHVSANNVLARSKELYMNDFFQNYSDLAASLPPTFFYVGGFLGIMLMFNIKYENFNRILKICSFFSIIPYLVTMFYPQIYMVYAMKIVIGFFSGIISLLLPQIFYSLGSSKNKNSMTALFPVFLLLGLSLCVGLIPFSGDYYMVINSIPIVLAAIGFATLFYSTSCIQEKTQNRNNEEKSGVIGFLTSKKTYRSAIIIVLIQLAYRMTGVDFIGLFSSTLFKGEWASLMAMSPFAIAICLILASGKIPDRIGRKNTYVIGLVLMSIVCTVFYFFGVNIISLSFYSVILNLTCSSIPYSVPIELVNPEYRSVANELSCIVIYILSICVALYIALIYVNESTFIWITFAAITLLMALVLSFVMVETLYEPNNGKLVSQWINPFILKSFKQKFIQSF